MTNVKLYKSRSFVTTWHFLALAYYAYAMYYDTYFVRLPVTTSSLQSDIEDIAKGRKQYITYWSLVVQALYFSISFLNDLIGTNEIAPKKMPLIRKFKDNFLASLAFPVALSVSMSFWGIFSIDRELIYPKILDLYIPTWLNHVMHTNIFVFIMLELCTSFRKYPTRKFGLSVLGGFLISYLIWIHIVKYYSGAWVYPILEVLPIPARFGFFAVMLVFTFGLYIVGEFLNEKIWTKEMKLAQIQPRKVN